MPDSPGTLEVLKALVVLRRVLRAGPTGGTEPDLPTGQVQVLLHLAERGQMTMGKLAAELGVSRPAATDVVDRLVLSGLVERVTTEDDRRKVYIRLTPASEALAESVLAARRAKVVDVLKQLSPTEWEGFVRGLQLLAAALAEDTEGLAGFTAAEGARLEAGTSPAAFSR